VRQSTILPFLAGSFVIKLNRLRDLILLQEDDVNQRLLNAITYIIKFNFILKYYDLKSHRVNLGLTHIAAKKIQLLKLRCSMLKLRLKNIELQKGGKG